MRPLSNQLEEALQLKKPVKGGLTMKVTLANVRQIPFLPTAVLLAILLPGCPTPPPPPELPVKKAIVTNLGEVVKEARYIGDTIRYRVPSVTGFTSPTTPKRQLILALSIILTPTWTT
jgi:hypothetical protein